jgi:hypothetical protein
VGIGVTVKPSKFILKRMPATADNIVLKVNTQGLSPSQALGPLAESAIIF